MPGRYFSLATLVLVSFIMQAYECWMQPDKFICKVGEHVKIRLVGGENFMGEALDLRNQKIEELQWHHPSGTTDLLGALKRDVKDNLDLTLSTAGTHMLTFKCAETLKHVEAGQFNAYLKENGLDDALYYRETKNLLDKPTKEYHTQYSKLLLQAGDRKDDTYKKDTSFPVAIMPINNPYNLKTGDLISFKVLWQGKPFFGAKVKVWNRHNNRTTIQYLYPEKDGTVKTHISAEGSWMVSVTKMVPSTKEGADWQSYKTTLVFGIRD